MLTYELPPCSLNSGPVVGARWAGPQGLNIQSLVAQATMPSLHLESLPSPPKEWLLLYAFVPCPQRAMVSGLKFAIPFLPPSETIKPGTVKRPELDPKRGHPNS